jgi:CBS domain-containing protein
MTSDVITTTKNTNLSDIARIMITKRVSGLPVVNKKGDVIGIITANDLFMVMDMVRSGDVLDGGKAGSRVPTVGFAMSTDLHKARRSTSLEEIIILMKYSNVHTLPVFHGKKMVGVIGRRDVFKRFYAVVKDLIESS